jgi:hypothetical protein
MRPEELFPAGDFAKKWHGFYKRSVYYRIRCVCGYEYPAIDVQSPQAQWQGIRDIGIR